MFSLHVDDWTHSRHTFTLQPHSEKHWTIDVADGVNVLKTRHEVSLQTFGGNATFHFVKDYNTTDTGPIPTPEIRDVEIGRGVVDGEETTVAYVTVTNPTRQPYPMFMLVHTLETDGDYPIISAPPGETQVVRAELDEPPGSRVTGEVRLYLQRPDQPRRGLHQVEFSGAAEGGTEHWNQSYRKIRPPWDADPYRYENASVDPDVGPYGVPTTPRAYALYATAALALLGLYAAWRKLTSPA